MKVVMIIGNGFNNLISNLVSNYPENKKPKQIKTDLKTIAANIRGITTLWEKFNIVFASIKDKHPNLNDEEIIKIFHSIVDFLSKEEIFKKLFNYTGLDEFQNLLSDFLINHIKEIANDFRRYENLEGYKALKALFPKFGIKFNHLLKVSKIEKIHICTTNYDGVLDTLLTDYPQGYFFKDGFKESISSNSLGLVKNLDIYPKFLSHIHGSYKFQKDSTFTYKLRGDIINENPVMVFNNPDLKELMIRSDYVLNEYYRKLASDLREYDRLIIFGNSFKNEPHLKKLIYDNFNRRGTELVVCSREPENVKKELVQAYQGPIYDFSTSEIYNEVDLINLFNLLFKDSILESMIDNTLNNRVAA